MDRRIESIIEAVADLGADLPELDKDDLESRLSDLENDCRNLLNLSWNEMESAVEQLADEIHSLYNEL